MKRGKSRLTKDTQARTSDLDLHGRGADRPPVDQVLQLLHEDERQNRVRAVQRKEVSVSTAQAVASQGVSVTYVRRNHAGVQPFIRNRGPSLRRPWVVIWRRLCLNIS